MLLGMSWVVQIYFPVQDLPGLFERSITLEIDDSSYEIVYHKLESPAPYERPTLVLLPDIYFEYESVLPVAEQVRDSVNVIIPVLKSLQQGETPDRFTVEHKVKLLKELLPELGIDQFHLAGHAYGGLTAIQAAVEMPDQVRSLTLIGSLGVQELRFLGNYHINRSLYSLSRPFVNFYKYAFPHFGRFHQQRFSLEYVDAMRYLDQRDVRDQLRSIENPVLILHAENDQIIPPSTARENFRMVPQSELVFLEGKHEQIWLESDVWGEQLREFIDRVVNGQALTREEADEERINLSAELFDSDDVEPLSGKALVIIMILIMFFTIFSEDLSVIAAGLLTAGGVLPFQYSVLSCFLGILLVDVNIFWLGKNIGNPILKRVPFRWMIEEQDLIRAKNLFEMYGMELLFVARFIPGARFPTYFAAGLLKTGFKKFFVYFLLSITVWTPLLVGLSVLIGQPMMQYISIYQDYAIWILLLTVAMIYLVVKVAIPLTTVRGRRRLTVKWARFWQRRNR